MRMQQQMYMYYYSLYQNGFNPMMNPQMPNNFMNPPFNNYGSAPTQGKNQTPNNGGPFSQMNPMNQMP